MGVISQRLSSPSNGAQAASSSDEHFPLTRVWRM